MLTRKEKINKLKIELDKRIQEYENREKEGEFSVNDYINVNYLNYVGGNKCAQLRCRQDIIDKLKKEIKHLKSINEIDYLNEIIESKDKRIKELEDVLEYHHIDY